MLGFNYFLIALFLFPSLNFSQKLFAHSAAVYANTKDDIIIRDGNLYIPNIAANNKAGDDSISVPDLQNKTNVGVYFGVMLPNSEYDNIDPSVGVTVAPFLIDDFLQLPIDLAVFYHNRLNSWAITRLSLSLQYNVFQTDVLKHYIRGGGTLEFTEETFKFNLCTGLNYKKFFIEGRVLLWRETGDNSTITNLSPLIINVGFLI